ncbi:MAG: MgtC/SapB family protein [Clostridia bacterium]|nr:MgtC/SapB family protein [Clostridia bacterium]
MTELEYFLRVVIAGACGILIGYERKNRAKEAGIRTHCIVACAAALMMIVSKYGFADLAGDAMGTKGVDPARIAAQVVSGVGFLGAGMIFVQKQSIKGLTTAAGMWATAGIGMAIGAGMYIIGIAVALFILVIQTVLHKNMRFLKNPHLKRIVIKNINKKDFQKELSEKLAALDITMEEVNVSYDKEKGTCNYSFTIELAPDVMEDTLISLFPYDTEIVTLR